MTKYRIKEIEMEKEDIDEILEIVNMAKGFKPVVDESLSVLKEYVPCLKEVYSGFLDYGIEMKDYAIKEYGKRGYTKDEAILLVLDSNASFKSFLNKWEYNIANSKKKKDNEL